MNNRIQIIQGDITELEVDAIVNAANSGLRGGAGVDGAIHRAGGPSIMEECRKLGGCPTGHAVVTSGGKLKAKWVIHAVGPVWSGGHQQEDKLLSDAYKNSLLRAKEHQAKSVVFPNISTGIYGFPKERAAEIAYKTVSDFLSRDESIELVIFCCYDRDNYNLYSQLMQR
jgi:O-acetyl-ADP-ribose deacetylase (regulator of RNase III)